MNSTNLIAVVTAIGSILFGLMERWEKIEVARVMAQACDATVAGLVQ